MVSNALSIKSFGTKTPAVCHPPPWPPTIPIPPIHLGRFFCFATYRSTWGAYEASVAGSCVLRPNNTGSLWIGDSRSPPHMYGLVAEMSLTPTTGAYGIQVQLHYAPPTAPGPIWRTEAFLFPRPFVGSRLVQQMEVIPGVYTCTLREIPP